MAVENFQNAPATDSNRAMSSSTDHHGAGAALRRHARDERDAPPPRPLGQRALVITSNSGLRGGRRLEEAHDGAGLPE